MVSACKKKSIEDSVNKAIAKAGGGGSGGDEATTVTKKNKEAVLKACLPLINTKLKEKWGKNSETNLFLRRSTVWQTTQADPLVVLYTGPFLPLQLTEHGLGKDKATVTENLNKMAASEVIQKQFVARDGNASGWRVHISRANTDVTILEAGVGKAPDAPEAKSGVIIYDRENTINAKGQISSISKRSSLNQANEKGWRGGWFECVVNDTTEAVTFKYTDADLTFFSFLWWFEAFFGAFGAVLS